MIDRKIAYDLVSAQHPEQNMLQHAIDSERVMRALAAHFGEDADVWGLAGLLHDIDYPMTKNSPEKHGVLAAELLAGKVTDDIIYAIQAHNTECTGVEPKSMMDLALRAGESVTGLVTAAALVRPTGMEGMQASSLKKKMKDKSFAASVDRERIKECERIGLALDQFLTLAIGAMSEK
ncbi:MAG: HDIG domain-containing protein [Deferribacteraceae bacterium]|jgi:putative nucleotidyltransferase with HDIG domain|nr:HDIG domain-containing protein [Deferribacteraceae bacterium]